MIRQILFAVVDRLTEVKIEESGEHHCSSPHQLGHFDDPVYENNRIREEVRNDVKLLKQVKRLKVFNRRKFKLLKNQL